MHLFLSWFVHGGMVWYGSWGSFEIGVVFCWSYCVWEVPWHESFCIGQCVCVPKSVFLPHWFYSTCLGKFNICFKFEIKLVLHEFLLVFKIYPLIALTNRRNRRELSTDVAVDTSVFKIDQITWYTRFTKFSDLPGVRSKIALESVSYEKKRNGIPQVLFRNAPLFRLLSFKNVSWRASSFAYW